jgi:DNA-directed RNA polymerase subunit K/omega
LDVGRTKAVTFTDGGRCLMNSDPELPEAPNTKTPPTVAAFRQVVAKTAPPIRARRRESMFG